jgi:ketosteroid isomerase-like protein
MPPGQRSNAAPETVAWLTRYYELLDQNRVGDAIRGFIADDCTFRFGNGEPTGFLDEARRMSKLVKGFAHRLLTVLEGEDGTIACELEVTYVKQDGSSITLPAALFARVEDGRFVEQRAYIDHGPLLA